MNIPNVKVSLNVAEMAPRERHPKIMSTFDELAVGEAFEIIVDHAPRPLEYQFAYECPNQYQWQYVENGPELWRVVITRTASK